MRKPRMKTIKFIAQLLTLGYKVCGHERGNASFLSVLQLSKGDKQINIFEGKYLTYFDYYQNFNCLASGIEVKQED